MEKDTFIVALPPRRLHQLQGWRVTPAHLAYRLGRGGRLLRGEAQTPLKGGLMVVDDQDFDGAGNVTTLCQDILRECQVHFFSGAVLDFEYRLPQLEQLSARLDGIFTRQGLALYVPEFYGQKAGQAGVLIPSALSGGSLALRLEEAGERFGRGRVVLALEKRAEDFLLPASSGSGLALTQTELADRMTRLRPSVFFSRELCARYFTYMNRDSGAHFVLFDDGDTLARKLEAGRQAGVHRFFLPWDLLEAHGNPLGVPQQIGQPPRP